MKIIPTNRYEAAALAKKPFEDVKASSAGIPSNTGNCYATAEMIKKVKSGKANCYVEAAVLAYLQDNCS